MQFEPDTDDNVKFYVGRFLDMFEFSSNDNKPQKYGEAKSGNPIIKTKVYSSSNDAKPESSNSGFMMG